MLKITEVTNQSIIAKLENRQAYSIGMFLLVGVSQLMLTILISCGGQEEPITQEDPPKAAFSESINQGEVKFLNESTNADVFSWDFGDNSTSVEKNPTHVYNSSGEYQVTLKATKQQSSDEFSKTITIAITSTDPTANFSFSIDGGQVTFINESQRATLFEWDFGDGNASSLENPKHVYTSAGTYEITLTAANGDKSDKISKELSLDAPTAEFDFEINNEIVTFKNLSQHADAFEWDFGDGNSSTEENPIHAYTNKGEYTATLKASGLNPESVISKALTISNIEESETLGIKWIEATSNAGFGIRQGFTCLVFNDRIYLMGGLQGTFAKSLKNDIWSTQDGKTWSLVTEEAAWAPRYNHACIIFKNKMWLIGGNVSTDQSVTDDVWSSVDGINWINEDANKDWTDRAGHTLNVFQDKLWLLGGGNDVWNSIDGITWERVIGSSPWNGDDGLSGILSGHTSFVLQNKIMLMGGNDGLGRNKGIWSSENGIDWSLVNNGFSSLSNHSTIVINDRVWLLAGLELGVVNEDIVSFSNDGNSWESIALFEDEIGIKSFAPFWKARHGHVSVVFKKRIYIIGGNANTDVWYTE